MQSTGGHAGPAKVGVLLTASRGNQRRPRATFSQASQCGDPLGRDGATHCSNKYKSSSTKSRSASLCALRVRSRGRNAHGLGSVTTCLDVRLVVATQKEEELCSPSHVSKQKRRAYTNGVVRQNTMGTLVGKTHVAGSFLCVALVRHHWRHRV